MLATLITAALLGLADPGSAQVSVEPLKFSVEALKALPQVELKVTDRGKTVTYAGVPLRAVMGDRFKPKAGMAEIRGLSDSVLLVRASDDYQAAVSAAAVAMDEAGTRYFLALTRDGEPLDESHGPVELVIPGDPMHVRWVRMVTAVDLIRLPAPRAK